MLLLLSAICAMTVLGFIVIFIPRTCRWGHLIGAAGPILGTCLGLPPAIHVLLTGKRESLHLPWQVPHGSFLLELDSLSAFFLLPILSLCAVTAIYATGYLKTKTEGKSPGRHWFFFNLLCSSMVLVTLAANGILFLFAWEVMSLSSFFLVTHDDETPTVRDAGWVYLVATHIGGAILTVLFLLLGRACGSLDFYTFFAIRNEGPLIIGTVFLLALIGFGTKAGFIPFHVWLPEAHPAAPSHVSALMSGVMIKTGIYGILRIFIFLGPPEPWWGWSLLGIGLVSGVLGVLFALVQHDLKRLLAYHSVENIGIIAIGLGFGILGISLKEPILAVLGLAGGLLHVLNHSLFKGLLFLCAGAVLHTTHTREIDHLGGLVKRMPWTSAFFLLGSVAICGLPPLNGFVSEFLIYLGAFHGTGLLRFSIAGILTITGLAMIGTLAVSCFTKAFGIVFLGEPRSDHAVKGHEVNKVMRIAMLLPAMGCIVIGFGASLAPEALHHVLQLLTGMPDSLISYHLHSTKEPLSKVATVSVIGVLLLSVLFMLRRALFAHQVVRQSGTWDCGYLKPDSRMQYTASSFAQPIKAMFQALIPTRRMGDPVEDIFPRHASLLTESPDLFQHRLFIPLFRSAGKLMLKWHGLQQGRVQLYVLYVAVTLLVLLVWNLK